MLAPFTIFWLSGCVWFFSDEKLFDDHPHLFINAFGIAHAYLAVRALAFSLHSVLLMHCRRA
jgi:hypothetical protein